MKFSDLRLAEPILRAVASEGYDVPTPIQTQAIPHVLDGRDLLGCAQTGTGKTAAFALPILTRLLEQDGQTAAEPELVGAASNQVSQPSQGYDSGRGRSQRGNHRGQRGNSRSNQNSGPRRPIRTLVLSPTRELAAQIHESFTTYGKFTDLRSTVVYGGVSQGAQTQALSRGVDILVATPGRLLDLINQGYIKLDTVNCLVLDEADRMLDMGFIHDIRKIVAMVPSKRQTLFFSATMPGEIRQLSKAILTNPINIEVARMSATADNVDQTVYHTSRQAKPQLLAHFLSSTSVTRAIVFTRTKHGADNVTKFLSRAGLRAEAIHGDKSQSQRMRALANFKASKTPILVATDIAARGLDVDNISHVVNFDLPFEPETYVHRIGRTARAGAAGEAVSFCTPEVRSLLRAIERLTRSPLRVVDDHPFPDDGQEVALPAKRQRHRKGPGGQHQNQSGSQPVSAQGGTATAQLTRVSRKAFQGDQPQGPKSGGANRGGNSAKPWQRNTTKSWSRKSSGR
ncbi:MAG: DEAD/DEAH box helicase [Phycisphaeraceae bacterium]